MLKLAYTYHVRASATNIKNLPIRAYNSSFSRSVLGCMAQIPGPKHDGLFGVSLSFLFFTLE